MIVVHSILVHRTLIQMKETKIFIPEYVERIIKRLEAYGFEAFVVGGCVRDSILGIMPHDWDVCTSALPEQTAEVLGGEFHIIPTGIKHGTVTAVAHGEAAEITTFRTDGLYTDCRRPESVSFVGDVKDDLCRRDFTINAMAYNLKRGLVDLFGGREDLKCGIIRCVGDAEKRFSEDALRILRALRFAAVFGFDVECETDRAIRKKRGLLSLISAERIFSELKKLLTAERPSKILINYREVFEVIIPECFSVTSFSEVNMKAADLVANKPYLRIAAVLGAAEDTDVIMRRLKSDNEMRKTVADVCKAVKQPTVTDRIAARQMIRQYGAETAAAAAELRPALAEAAGGDAQAEKKAEEELCGVIGRGDCCTIGSLAVGGRDLLGLGIEGQRIGFVLNCLLDGVILEKIPNDRDALLRAAKAI